MILHAYAGPADHCIDVLARRLVTVCLSGDGSDELFASYPRIGSRLGAG